MKKIFLSVRFLLLIIAVFSIGLFVYQVRETSIIKRKLSDRKGILQEIRGAKRKSQEIRKKIAENKLREAEILKRIPKDKESIFVLMKELTTVGNSVGIRNISFVPEKLPQKNNQSSKRDIMRRGRSVSKDSYVKAISSGLIIPHNFQMTFAASYMELYDFIKKIISMERVVSLESIEIERNKEYFPRQKVNLKLTTYTFSSSK